MKAKFFLLLFTLFSISAFAQNPSKAQKELNDRLSKMDPKTRKMYDSIMNAMGASQVLNNALKGGNNNQRSVTNGLAMMPSGDPNKISATVSKLAIPSTPADKEKLIAYLKPFFLTTQNAMNPAHIKSVESLMNQKNITGKYAMVFWTHNELDKALYLLENACITNPEDYLSINNLAALLTMTGYAHKALPLLLYAQKVLPESGTLLSNIGQAYLSLGYVDKAKTYLMSAIEKDTSNAESYRSMAMIAKSQGNNKLCGEYLVKTIANGGATSEAINLLNQVAPGTDLSETIRNRFKQFYKDHSITKQFLLPPVPGSYSAATDNYLDIDTYFKNLDATITAAEKTGRELLKENENQIKNSLQKRSDQIKQLVSNAGKPGYAQSLKSLKSSLSNPLMAQGAIMMASIDNPQYSKSYLSRMKDEMGKRDNSEAELKANLKLDFDNKINALIKEQKKLNDGEGMDAENVRMVEIEKELCKLKQGRQDKWLEKIAEINNQYIHNVEDLLNQRLQEYLFWNTIVMQSQQDPTAVNYSYYVQYLKDLESLKSLYPYYVDGGFSRPCGANLEENKSAGKIHEWEREHCDVDINIDLKVTSGNMNCEGWSVSVDFKEGSFAYTRSIDPVTWETTGHSISAKAGKDKEFEITKNIKGKIGASVETTIKFDGNMNPVDLGVKGTVGAEASGPYGGKAGMDLFTEEISVKGGFNAAGPPIPNIFK